MERPAWLLTVKFDSCNNLLSFVHIDCIIRVLLSFSMKFENIIIINSLFYRWRPVLPTSFINPFILSLIHLFSAFFLYPGLSLVPLSYLSIFLWGQKFSMFYKNFQLLVFLPSSFLASCGHGGSVVVFGASGAEGLWFKSHSSRHTGTVGKAFTRSCLYDVMWRPAWLPCG